MPFGHLPIVFCAVNFSFTVVVPLPPFHVIFVVRLPVILAMGTVTFPDPPAARPAGVQVRKLDETVPVLAVRLSDVVDANFAHATLGFSCGGRGQSEWRREHRARGDCEDERASPDRDLHLCNPSG